MIEKDSSEKYQIILIVMVLSFIAIVVFAIILSYVTEGLSKDNNSLDDVAIVLNEGDLAINYIDGNKIDIKGKEKKEYTISITNISLNKLYYSVFLENVSLEDDVDLKFYSENEELVFSSEDGLENELISLFVVNPSETIRYKLVVEGNKKTSFDAEIKVVNESLTTQTFSDLILLDNTTSLSQTKVGSEISTIDEGLIRDKDDLGDTYYFRGDVKNNYVKMGDLYFRVVRINGDGTVRIVLDNVIDTQYAYNTNPLGENMTLGSLASLQNATLSNNLIEWFNNNLKEYENYVVPGNFCTDVEFPIIVNGDNYSTSYTRIYIDNSPSLKCSGSLYTSKVGLLSVDEVVYAGAYKKNANTKYYLYNENISGNYLTNSSFFINTSSVISMMNVMSDGSLGDGVLVDNLAYIRPVINISVNAKVKGKGTFEEPYVIVS